ncbi:GGDEF domain-containing protein [Candidatus Epulonipiscium viviparus]|uniref:GGDEF domain-containing protein n=1 Tax=Candidatus Epulonipiscium viviparus TaxID=420336 RepID=UPI0027380CF7|nr:GGDEF domain-containing protein [Candidatus Epulopiscium viviparus]
MVSDDVIIGVIALVLNTAYSYVLLHVASKMVEDKSTSFIKKLMFSIANMVLYSLVYAFKVPHYIYYIFVFTAIMMELYSIGLTAKEGACIASHAIVNISAIFLACVKLITAAYGVPANTVFTNIDIRLQIVSVMYILAMLVGVILFRNLGAENLKKVLSAKGYSEALTVLGIILTCYVAVDEYIIILGYSYEDQIIMVLATVFLVMSLYYLILYYTIKSLNIIIYREKTEAAKISYTRLVSKHNGIMNKVLKDELTDLYNKKYVINYISKMLAEPGTENTKQGIIFLDINGLKYVNDTFGHKAGDKLILDVTSAVRNSIREKHQDIAGRIGGDEILIFIPNIHQAGLDKIVERIRNNIRRKNEAEKDFLVAASIGAIMVDGDMAKLGLNNILEKVDVLMRMDKEKFYKEMEEKNGNY